MWLWGFALFLEVPTIVSEAKYLLIAEHAGYSPSSPHSHRPNRVSLGLFAACMILGFGVNLMSFLVIKYTNAVTLKVIGTARSAGLVWVGVALQVSNCAHT